MKTILFCLFALTLSGCSLGEKIGIGTVITNAATHVEPTITYDATTNVWSGSVHFKDAQGRDCVRELTPDEIAQYQARAAVSAPANGRKQCEQCNDAARKQLKESFAQTKREMNAIHNRELERLKSERKHCADLPLGEVVSIPVQTAPHVPQVGDVIESGDIPESGTMKSVR